MVFRNQDLVYHFYAVCLSRAVAMKWSHRGMEGHREGKVGIDKDKQSTVLIIRAEAEG